MPYGRGRLFIAGAFAAAGAATFYIQGFAHGKFFFFAFIPVLYRAQVAYYAGIHFTFWALYFAHFFFEVRDFGFYCLSFLCGHNLFSLYVVVHGSVKTLFIIMAICQIGFNELFGLVSANPKRVIYYIVALQVVQSYVAILACVRLYTWGIQNVRPGCSRIWGTR